MTLTINQSRLRSETCTIFWWSVSESQWIHVTLSTSRHNI